MSNINRVYERIEGLARQLPTNDTRGSNCAENPKVPLRGELPSEVSCLADLVNRYISHPKRVLADLQYATRAMRHDQIMDSYAGTLQWVFGEEGDNGFPQWLRTGEGVFWFVGKVCIYCTVALSVLSLITDFNYSQEVVNQLY
jgi:hypothetical protein